MDDDLLPDDWELAVGCDPTDPADALSDPDADGLNNLMELLYGRDPMVPDADDTGTLSRDGGLTTSGGVFPRLTESRSTHQRAGQAAIRARLPRSAVG